ncbi:hypothetical protein KNE206_02510 [Kitasatospora sp. NE20-6]
MKKARAYLLSMAFRTAPSLTGIRPRPLCRRAAERIGPPGWTMVSTLIAGSAAPRPEPPPRTSGPRPGSPPTAPPARPAHHAPPRGTAADREHRT